MRKGVVKVLVLKKVINQEQIDIISDLTYNYRDVIQNNQKNTKLLIK